MPRAMSQSWGAWRPASPMVAPSNLFAAASQKSRRPSLASSRPEAPQTPEKPGTPEPPRDPFEPLDDGSVDAAYFKLRRDKVKQFFDCPAPLDDFLARVEIELKARGFDGDNSIAFINLCRDEICNPLATRIGDVFGDYFNVHGLGGVLTCGVTGMGAGLSHAPKHEGVREKYVFFSFPHVGVSASGELGVVSRADCNHSHACGAILKCMSDLKKGAGKEPTACKPCGSEWEEEEYDEMDPEYSILKARMEQYVSKAGVDVQAANVAEMTCVAERMITADLETLISHAVDTSKADYAVITGVQIHNWSEHYEEDQPNFEFIQPASLYTVINGRKTEMDLGALAAITPRMMRLLRGMSEWNPADEILPANSAAEFQSSAQDGDDEEMPKSLTSEKALAANTATLARLRQKHEAAASPKEEPKAPAPAPEPAATPAPPPAPMRAPKAPSGSSSGGTTARTPTPDLEIKAEDGSVVGGSTPSPGGRPVTRPRAHRITMITTGNSTPDSGLLTPQMKLI